MPLCFTHEIFSYKAHFSHGWGIFAGERADDHALGVALAGCDAKDASSSSNACTYTEPKEKNFVEKKKPFSGECFAGAANILCRTKM